MSGNCGSVGKFPVAKLTPLLPPGPTRGGGTMGLDPPTEAAILRRAPSSEGSKRRQRRFVTSSRAVIIRSLSVRFSRRVSILFAMMSAWAWMDKRSLLMAGPFSFLQPSVNSSCVRPREPSPSRTSKSFAASSTGSCMARMRHITFGSCDAFRNSSRSIVPVLSLSVILKTSAMLSSSAFPLRSSFVLFFFLFFSADATICCTMTATTMFMVP
mmetsp:Transcript_88431/g.286334  ORF Transcript_88431/g.286334 Transcript_88431/m.286334 type:complete len:213 (+) Transcript_88431:141-779(+)